MGIGDSIGKAAENAMEDLAGTSKPTEKMDVPDPADPNDDVEVHSSLSEGSNAMEAEKQKAPGLKAGAAPAPLSTSPLGGDVDETDNDSAHNDRTDDGGLAGDASAPTGRGRTAAGPAGLPDSNPDELRADPTEGDADPSTSTGRG
ncbi:hypothetical protein [Pseudarthrobacter enclensis]|uniref:Uncharacterized protein n=1 Tax=Pseudarthrobacter enclensis TaxID=993070 RepID=A0ABT9RQP6_9MICC|nr:hypothetical protein [Pseudarthrobacter enclensis]MDP9887548.1 hypothetical protein [Pseudarthrobacter enclensis]